MELSTFDDLIKWATLGLAALAATILIWFLLRRPPLVRTTKLALLMGIGILPIGSAVLGNYHGYEKSREEEFCGGCHVMTPYTDDLNDPDGTSLASMHGRNEAFGGAACYECHRNYGMFGTITTKLNGMRHVYLYATEFKDMTIEEALPKIHIRQAYPNSNCMQCHSTRLQGFGEVPEHMGLTEDVRSGKVSCASEGCHGPAHPFSKPKPLPGVAP
jgi:nitrate/TMAO reductase-like tetraheme cytochrome c subunit